MKQRAPLTLAAVTAALAALTGIAALTAPAAGGTAPDGKAAAAARMPVERSLLVCPAPSSSDIADTTYTAFTPGAAGSAEGKGSARLLGATKDAKPVLEPKEVGKPFGATASGADAPALTGSADGVLAPGWTAQMTTKVSVGRARGVLGASCTAPGTDFWFPAVSTAKGREDYVHLTNPDDAAAVVDIKLFGPDGLAKPDAGTSENIRIDPKSSKSVLLSSLVPGSQLADATAHVTTRAGRVGASVQVAEEGVGADWLPAAADPAGSLVLPGIPADAVSVRLVAFVPGDEDADLKVRLAAPGGAITPAGNEQLHVKAGMTASVDLKDVTRGEPGSLLLTPADPKKAAPVVAAVRVVRGSGAKQELGFVQATAPVGTRATVADNRPEENATVLSLTAAGDKDAKVKVTASPGTGGGEAASQEVTVKAGTTQVVAVAPAGGKGSYALTVETLSGGPVHAARTLNLPHEGISMFTVQTLSDDHSTVSVPRAAEDLSVLTR
ncbi:MULTISPECIES: DUF5719 family protein [unclassified Streptomyces]|uniref:DUF5719 family protein n=1 Tax=unclassified Streptomyces TaxID=2593676 RepID=UPI002259BEE6|nr:MULTISPECIES: DUF5719 family protein [unclassified Streptomyces]MCX5013621.1 DUF5719 family protein [Streptomyces sp. NBC_00555]MCX5607639.1 DUF5719 family protein [Streptomyces sp. NBC_00047]